MFKPRFKPLFLVALASSAAWGCMPAVTHGPKVIPGTTGGFSFSYPVGPKYSQGDWGAMAYLYGPIGLNLNVGSRAEANEGAWLVGAHLPLIGFFAPPASLAVTQVDVYRQFAPRQDLFGGVGLSVNPAQAMPYVQVGRINEKDSGWYTTQGIAVFRDDTSWNQREIAAVMWLPTIAYQNGGARQTTHLFMTVGIGTELGECTDYNPGCRPNEMRYAATAGVSVQFHARRR